MRNAKTLSDVSTAIANREEFRFTTMHGYHTNAPVPAGYSMEFANKVNDAIRAMKQVYVTRTERQSQQKSMAKQSSPTKNSPWPPPATPT